MKIKVRFFDNEIIKAIGSGIYKISVQRKIIKENFFMLASLTL